MPYNGNSCQQTTRCSSTPHQSVPGVGAFPVPITLPVNIVPPEPFPHSLAVNTLSASPMSTHGNTVQIMTSQPQHQQIQTHQQLTQQPNQQQQQEEQTPDLITFQMCQSNDLLYTNMDATTNQPQRPPRI